jgi:signal transduction histidine kinase
VTSRLAVLASLRNRVFLASAAVAVFSIAFALVFVTGRVAREAEAELARGLQDAAALLEQQQAARSETLTLVARLIADLPKLKAAVETGDPPTVQPLAQDYRVQARADALALTGRNGRLLAESGRPGAAPDPQDAPGETRTRFRRVPEGVLQVVTVPITIGAEPVEVLGTLSAGFVLDRARAAELGSLTQSDVAIVFGGRVAASTLSPGREAALDPGRVGTGPEVLTLGDAEYVALRRTLSDGSGPGRPEAVILRSRTERLHFLRTFRAGLFAAALLAVALAVVLSYLVARTVTGPLAAITAAMREMAKTGDLGRRVALPHRWDDEDARLLAGSFNALTEATVRFQREAALRERLSALGRLSTVIAHEVRNPLMIIKGSLRTLRRPDVPPAERAEVASDIDNEVARLNRIVDDVLDFARPIRLELAPVDLGALCRDAAAATLSGEGAPASLIEIGPGLEGAITDGERLRAALVNVLGNAREAVAGAAREEDGLPAIELSAVRAEGGRAVITVRDRGTGITPADLTHVFEPYFTTKRTGTGLGLAIAKNIVEALGGSLEISSVPGTQTEVRIAIPTDGRAP